MNERHPAVTNNMSFKADDTIQKTAVQKKQLSFGKGKNKKKSGKHTTAYREFVVFFQKQQTHHANSTPTLFAADSKHFKHQKPKCNHHSQRNYTRIKSSPAYL
jgi:hypothetical protein